jgi:hypothetical protein
VREEIWSNGTEVQEQLFGNLEQLHQTTMYITEAGMRIPKKNNFHMFNLVVTIGIIFNLLWLDPAG